MDRDDHWNDPANPGVVGPPVQRPPPRHLSRDQSTHLSRDQPSGTARRF